MKKGLIIQGPLISIGRTGKTANIAFSKLTPKDIVEYDCCDNIIKIFDKYGDLFDHIVVVTWSDQDKELLNRLKSSLPKESLLLIEDSTKTIEAKGNLIPGNNKYRLFLSVYEGSKFLSDLGCEYIFKVRSDQFLDIDLLVSDSLKKLINEKRNVILVPWLNIKNSYTVLEIPDHYFAAKTKDMLDFTREYLTTPEIFDHIHTDIFFKWSLRSLASFSLIRKYIRVTSSFGNNILLNIVINPWISNGFFKPLDNNILSNLYWRGEKLDIDVDINELSNDEIIYTKTKTTRLMTILHRAYNKIIK